MKLNRLIAILSVLLNQEQVTAPELAKRFEVSRRTINRDIEAVFPSSHSRVWAAASGSWTDSGWIVLP